MRAAKKLFTVFAITFALSACMSIDKSAVRAAAGAPESARVDELHIPYEANLPRYALIVQTFVKEGAVQETRTHSNTDSRWNTKQASSTSSSARKNSTTDETGSSQEDWNKTESNTRKAASQSNSKSSGESSESHNSSSSMPTLLGEIGGSSDGESSSSHQNEIAARDKSLTMDDKNASGSDDRRHNTSRENAENTKGSTRSDNNETGQSSTSSDILTTTNSREVDRNDVNIAAQFTSALSGVGNFVLLDPSTARQNADGTWSAPMRNGRTGPFVIKALVTEHIDEIEVEESGYNVPLINRQNGKIVKGVVGLDVTVIDGRTGELVTAFPTEGTYALVDKKSSYGLVLTINEKRAMARSVVEQAQRVALNEAAKRIHEELSTRYRSGLSR